MTQWAINPSISLEQRGCEVAPHINCEILLLLPGTEVARAMSSSSSLPSYNFPEIPNGRAATVRSFQFQPMRDWKAHMVKVWLGGYLPQTSKPSSHFATCHRVSCTSRICAPEHIARLYILQGLQPLHLCLCWLSVLGKFELLFIMFRLS